MSQSLAPIALFVYRRPEHARRTIASLQNCIGFDQSKLYVFADGPKTEADAAAVQSTRSVVRGMLGDRAVYVERYKNIGIASSIIGGASQLCEQFGSVIVVEDDLILSPMFLQFLNEGLQRYRDEPRVMQLSGHMFDVPQLRDESCALFLPMTTSWGWATWDRAWKQFDQAVSNWEDIVADKKQAKRFNLDGNYPFTRMLQREMTVGIGAWDIRWYASVFRQEGLGLFPPKTLVVNGGLDGSGTHRAFVRKAGSVESQEADPILLPDQIRESSLTDTIFASMGTQNRFSPLTYVLSKWIRR